MPNFKRRVDDRNFWKVERHISMAVIGTLLLQTCTAVWWASAINTRVGGLEISVGVAAVTAERVARVEEKVTAIKEALDRRR